MSRRTGLPTVGVLVLSLLSAAGAVADDWPMWRHDANRSASTDEQLADTLHLQWVRKYPPLRPTWPDAPRVAFDAAYEPVVLGKTMFVCLPQADKVVALDTETGAERWRFFADGPVRFAPVCWKDRVFVGSDDGHLYCVSAATGGLLWRFRGAPSDRKVIGHDRLISTWPISSGPVVADGTVYFSAGIWPFMDVFYHALDATTGKVVWTNDETSILFRAMPKGHSEATALSGPTPQGYAVVVGDRLLIPCGRSLPACFDRGTGKFLYYDPTAAAFYTRTPGRTNAFVSAMGNYFYNGDGVFELATGKLLREMAPVSVLTGEAVFAGPAAYDPTKAEVLDYTDWQKKKLQKLVTPKMYDLPAGNVRMKAGRRLYADSSGRILAFDLPAAPGGTVKETWSAAANGTVRSMLAADGKLFVVTAEGDIHCFGPEQVEAKTLEAKTAPLPVVEDDWTKRAAEILRRADAAPGYSMVLGVGSGRLIEELVRQSDLHVIGIDRERTRVEGLRRKFDAAGLYGGRVSLLVGDPAQFEMPPWVARLITSEAPPTAEDAFVRRVFRSLRPYGGVACFRTTDGEHAAFAKSVEEAKLSRAEVERSGGLTMLRRVGPLEGAGEWTHDNADAGRRTFSTDRAVKAPLGVLWFGGESGGGIFRDAGWLGAPSPLVFGGRMFLQGYGALYAVDVYTGRILWRTPLDAPEDPLHATRYVGAIGTDATNYCYTWAAAQDAIYLGHGDACIVFDPATGSRASEWKLPAGKETRAPYWGNLLVTDDVLVAASCTPVDLQKLPTDPAKLSARETIRLCEWLDIIGANILRLTTRPPEFMDQHLGDLLGEKTLAERYPRFKQFPAAASMELAERVVAVDRRTGRSLWTHEFAYGCQHNSALVAGGGRVFCVDGYPQELAEVLKRRGKLREDYAARLLALDLRTGSVLWSTTEDVWGVGGLSLAPKQKLVLQAAGRVGRERVARNAGDGTVVWKKRMEGEGYGFWHPSIITDDAVVNYHGQVYDLATGAAKTIEHPMTGEKVPWWLFTRSHGCNHAVASENLVLVRVGNAAYVDLLNFAGTHSLGGFRSSCQNNLIAADGVVSVPRYSGCSCAYPIFTSLGLVHDPELDVWSFFGTGMRVRGRVKRLGLNLGAPGDRRAEGGTLWLDCPSVGGPSPDVPVTTLPANVEWFRHRSAAIEGEGLKWVAASGGRGITEVTVTLAPGAQDEQTYLVRLHFCEPDAVGPGRRLFSVAIQGEKVLQDLDVVREAGGPNRILVREFKGVKVKEKLTVTLTPSPAAAVPLPILSGVEITME